LADDFQCNVLRTNGRQAIDLWCGTSLITAWYSTDAMSAVSIYGVRRDTCPVAAGVPDSAATVLVRENPLILNTVNPSGKCPHFGQLGHISLRRRFGAVAFGHYTGR
jgi:hypothetical protein